MTQGLPLPENNSLVYRHVRPDKNEVFYVGISLSDPQRPYDVHGRNKHWENVVHLCGGNYRVDILFQGLSCQEAWAKEKEFILIYGRKDLGTGTLVNMTEGGEGNIGRTYSEETRKKISKGVSGERHGMYGKTHSDEAKKKIGEAGKGRKMSEDHKKRLAKINKSNKHPNKIAQLRKGPMSQAKKVKNIVTGEVFQTIKDAAVAAGLSAGGLSKKLRGDRGNNTNFKFLEDGNL